MPLLRDRTLVKDLAAAITEQEHFARDASGALWVYRLGVFRPGADFALRQSVKRILVAEDCTERWSRSLTHEVIEYILLDAPELPDRPPLHLVNLENGMLDLRSRTLLPHSPAFLSSVRIPVVYRPDAVCPVIEQFVSEVFADDARALAWELFADLLTPDRTIQKAVCLYGRAGTGKSTFLDLLTGFIGPDNVANLSLHKLESDRFATARLLGKLANICSDLPNDPLDDLATFKAVTGGDRISAEVKYRSSFEFQPFARLVFSANELPRSRAHAEAHADRWIFVAFENRFRASAREVPRRVLESRLTGETELSGALNRALDALGDLRQRSRFTEPPSSRCVLRELRRAQDPFALWLDENTHFDPDTVTAQGHLYAAYVAHCTRERTVPISHQGFGRKLKALRPEIRERQVSAAGRRLWVYAGIRLRGTLAHAPAAT